MINKQAFNIIRGYFTDALGDDIEMACFVLPYGNDFIITKTINGKEFIISFIISDLDMVSDNGATTLISVKKEFLNRMLDERKSNHASNSNQEKSRPSYRYGYR